MSTVDAAIINHITNGGSSGGGGSGGVSYTAGDAISLSNNKISVQYDTSTMELKNGKLSAKSTSSGGGSTQILAGSGLRFDTNNTLHVNYDENTMELLDNGKLKARIFSGGNVPTEDIYEKADINIDSHSFENNWLLRYEFSNSEKYPKTGDCVRIRMRGDVIREFIIIRNSSEKLYDVNLSIDTHNLILLDTSNNDIMYGSFIKRPGFSLRQLAIICAAGSVEEDQSGDDVGFFRITQMSYNTLVKIIQHYNSTP